MVQFQFFSGEISKYLSRTSFLHKNIVNSHETLTEHFHAMTIKQKLCKVLSRTICIWRWLKYCTKRNIISSIT